VPSSAPEFDGLGATRTKRSVQYCRGEVPGEAKGICVLMQMWSLVLNVEAPYSTCIVELIASDVARPITDFHHAVWRVP
jgi:hypothetical protein